MVSCGNKTGTVGVVSRAPGKVATKGQSKPLACGQKGLAQVTCSRRGRGFPAQDSPSFLTRVWHQPDPVCLLDPYFDLVFLILTTQPRPAVYYLSYPLPPLCLGWARPLSFAWGVTRGRLGAPELACCPWPSRAVPLLQTSDHFGISPFWVLPELELMLSCLVAKCKIKALTFVPSSSFFLQQPLGSSFKIIIRNLFFFFLF